MPYGWNLLLTFFSGHHCLSDVTNTIVLEYNKLLYASEVLMRCAGASAPALVLGYWKIRTFYFRVLSTRITISEKELEKWDHTFFAVARSSFRHWRSVQLDKVQLAFLTRYFVFVFPMNVLSGIYVKNCKLFGRNSILVGVSEFCCGCKHCLRRGRFSCRLVQWPWTRCF